MPSSNLGKKVRVPDLTPSDRQLKFFESTAFETLYGGAAGGGKTAAIVAKAVTYALAYPKARIYIFRKTTPELEMSVVPEIYKQCAAYIDSGGMSYNSQKKIFQFRNGSFIQLSYLENPQDMFRYQSAEMHLLLVDELTHFTEDQYSYLKTRVRSTGEHPLSIMAATNPGNIGHGWVKSYFIDISAPETIFTDKNGNTRQFIPAKVTDHPSKEFIESYSKVLRSDPDPTRRKALLEGDWDIFQGQAFDEWRRDVDGKPYHVVDPFEIPKHWIKWFAYDWGYNTYAAGVWLTKDPSSDRIYLYREFYEHAMPASKQAETINMYSSDEAIRMRLADPSLWKQIGNAETGETVAAIFQRNNLIFQPANNDRKAGWNAVHESLAPMADGLPRLQVFSSCVNFLRTFPSLPVDINRVEDIQTKGVEDHLADALRYGLMNQQPSFMPEPKINQALVNQREKYVNYR